MPSTAGARCETHDLPAVGPFCQSDVYSPHFTWKTSLDSLPAFNTEADIYVYVFAAPTRADTFILILGVPIKRWPADFTT